MWLEREAWMGTCRLNVMPGRSVLRAAGSPGRSVHGSDQLRCVFGVGKRPCGRGLRGDRVRGKEGLRQLRHLKQKLGSGERLWELHGLLFSLRDPDLRGGAGCGWMGSGPLTPVRGKCSAPAAGHVGAGHLSNCCPENRNQVKAHMSLFSVL